MTKIKKTYFLSALFNNNIAFRFSIMNLGSIKAIQFSQLSHTFFFPFHIGMSAECTTAWLGFQHVSAGQQFLHNLALARLGPTLFFGEIQRPPLNLD